MQTKRCSKRGLMAMRENLLSIPYSARVFFLPAHARIFPWAGKNKSGYRDKKTLPLPHLFKRGNGSTKYHGL